jgi:hypothetical protein
LFAVGIAPIGRGDQLVAAEATSFMIDKRAGCLTYAEPDRDGKIGFSVDVAASVGNRRSDRFRCQADGTRGVMGGGRPALKLRLQLYIVRHQHGGPYSCCIRHE